MQVKYALIGVVSVILILLGAYVLIVDGGRLKVSDVVEIESNKNKVPQVESKEPSSKSDSKQNATASGSGNAVNADNGASVSIER